MSGKGLKGPFFFLHVTAMATTETLAAAPSWQTPQIKLRQIVDSLEPTLYQNVLLCKMKDQGEESPVLRGYLWDICLWWRHGGCLLLGAWSDCTRDRGV